MRISIIPVGSRGDVQPYTAIGKGLRRAGHSVRVVTHAPFEDFVHGNGLDFSDLGGDPRARVASMTDNGVNSRQRVWLLRPLADARGFIRAGNGMVRAVLEATPQMTENCWRGSRDADALVLPTFGALVGIPTARKLGVPALVAHPMPLVRTAEFPLPGVLPPAPAWLGPVRGWYNLLCGRSTEWFMAHSASA